MSSIMTLMFLVERVLDDLDEMEDKVLGLSALKEVNDNQYQRLKERIDGIHKAAFVITKM